ncbi:MAG: lyase family protein [Erythrobacter sp.]|nr:lyase family protein [Erythrobacter sp.]
MAAAFALYAAPGSAASCSISGVSELFEYEARTQTILEVEAAMARAQALEGYIPAEVASEITRQARVALVPQDRFDEEYARVRHRMVALLNVWRESLSDSADRYVHYGATTVDIYGTAAMLQADRTIERLDRCLARNLVIMSEMARTHNRTAMIGRTLGQHAQPITFGKKVSTWIDEYRRHRQRLAELRGRVRKSAILKGAVGNYSGLGPKAIAIEQSFARELGFDPPYAADWNGTRDVIAEYGLVLGLIAKSNQRIGQEIFLLQSTDIGEVREELPPGTVGSSSMPHKRNPRLPERVIHSGRTIPRLAEVLSDDVVNFYERDNTSRLSPVIADISIESMRALRTLAQLLEGLEVDAERMRANIAATRGFAMSQRVAFALSDHMPRADAEALVKAVIARALETDRSFAVALADDPDVSRHLDAQAISELLDGDRIEQPAIEQVERTLGEVAPGDQTP